MSQYWGPRRIGNPLRRGEDEEYQPGRSSTQSELWMRRDRTNKILDKLWEQWEPEYLLSLREIWQAQSSTGKKFNQNRTEIEGSGHHCGGGTKLRSTWRMGVMEELKPGRKERIRTVKARLSSVTGGLERSIC